MLILIDPSVPYLDVKCSCECLACGNPQQLIRTELYHSMPVNIWYLWSWIFGTACKLEDECIFAEIDSVNHLENECVQWLTCHT